MGKNNIQKFINFINKDANLTTEQRRRRNKLLATGEKPSKDNVQSGNEYIRPEYLHDFLYAYNQDDMLKYTCHEIDNETAVTSICKECGTETYSVIEHQKMLSNRFDALVKQIETKEMIDKRFYSLAKTVINGGQPWSNNYTLESWNCKGIQKWAEDNSGLIPNPGRNIARSQKSNGYKLEKPFNSHLNNRYIANFAQLTLFFKSLFHIRRDNPLKDLLEYRFSARAQDYYPNIKLEYTDQFIDNIELLTNVEKVICAFDKILEICNEAHKADEDICIQLSFYRREDNKVIFAIHDINSVYGKDLASTLSRIGEKQTELINIINGVCDLSIEADFGNGSAHVNLWHPDIIDSENKKKMNITSSPLDSFQGVKYLLIFPS